MHVGDDTVVTAILLTNYKHDSDTPAILQDTWTITNILNVHDTRTITIRNQNYFFRLGLRIRIASIFITMLVFY